ncbi:hypothetical protein M2130_002006, partial [Polynucleobacter sphagniphilus]|nr:hypothetical protein [Polynucleobacter sphagniphilus]
VKNGGGDAKKNYRRNAVLITSTTTLLA